MGFGGVGEGLLGHTVHPFVGFTGAGLNPGDISIDALRELAGQSDDRISKCSLGLVPLLLARHDGTKVSCYPLGSEALSSQDASLYVSTSTLSLSPSGSKVLCEH